MATETVNKCDACGRKLMKNNIHFYIWYWKDRIPGLIVSIIFLLSIAAYNTVLFVSITSIMCLAAGRTSIDRNDDGMTIFWIGSAFMWIFSVPFTL
jgi:hypothetical protein